MGYLSFKFGHIRLVLLFNFDNTLSVVFYINIVHRNKIGEVIRDFFKQYSCNTFREAM